MKHFIFEFSGRTTVAVDEIWPDGDWPENTTVLDVLEVLHHAGVNANSVIEAWNLGDILSLDVYEE